MSSLFNKSKKKKASGTSKKKMSKEKKKALKKKEAQIKTQNNVAIQIIRKLGVKEIIPTAALDLAKKAVNEPGTVSIEIHDGKINGYLVLCIDGWDIHDKLKLDDRNDENYDPQAMGTFSQMVKDSRRITSVTLSNDRNEGYLTIVPTKKTLESLQTIDAFQNHLNAKIFIWALLPSDLTEDDPKHQEVDGEVFEKSEHVSLSDLLKASEQNISPVVIDGKVTLPFNKSTNNDVKKATTEDTNKQETVKSTKDTADQKESASTNKPVKKVNTTNKSAADLFGEADAESNDESGLLSGLNLDNIPGLNSGSESNSIKNNTNNSSMNDDTKKESVPMNTSNNNDDVGTDNAIKDANGRYINGKYKGMTEDEMNQWCLTYGFEKAPTADDIAKLHQDKKVDDKTATASDSAVEKKNAPKPVVVKKLRDYRNLGNTDLQLHVDSHVLDTIRNDDVPYKFTLDKPKNEEDTLTITLNEKKKVFNQTALTNRTDHIKEIELDFQDGSRQILKQANELYSLTNPDMYGKVRDQIKRKYDKRRADDRKRAEKIKQESNQKYQQDAEAFGEAAKREAMAQYHRQYDEPHRQDVAAQISKMQRATDSAEAREMNEMNIERNADANKYVQSKVLRLSDILSNKYAVYKNDEKREFEKMGSQLSEYLSDNFDKMERQVANIRRIKDTNHEIARLKDTIKSMETSTREKIENANNENQRQMTLVKNDAAQQLRQKDQEVADREHQFKVQLQDQANSFKAQLSEANKRADQLNDQLAKADQDKIDALEAQEKQSRTTINQYKDMVESANSRANDLSHQVNDLRNQIDDNRKRGSQKTAMGVAIAALIALVVGLGGGSFATYELHKSTTPTATQQVQQPTTQRDQQGQQGPVIVVPSGNGQQGTVVQNSSSNNANSATNSSVHK